MKPELRREIRDLALVGGGAIPGALLRWQLGILSPALAPGLGSWVGADFLANMAGCLVLGLVLAPNPPRPRLVLAAGIGFCGSLTTFSSWMLELALDLRSGESAAAAATLLLSLLGGLALVSLGQRLGRTPKARRAGN